MRISFMAFLLLPWLISCTSELTIPVQFTLTGEVRISSLRENSRVQSGFVIGTAADTNGVSTVEVSLDGGGWSAASGTTNWKFKLPTGGSTWRRNTLHTLSVRSRNKIGGYSPPVTINVIKDRNRDINGDGYPDLVVHAINYGAGQGRVYIFYSRGTNGIPSSSVNAADTIITGMAGSFFGRDIALGDMNGDGYADLAVGANMPGSGRVYCYYSDTTNGINASVADAADHTITGSTAIGYLVDLHDYSDDGFDDLVVAGNDFYNVYFFNSFGSSGIQATSTASATYHILLSSSYATSINFGDINGDGIDDFVIGRHQNRTIDIFYRTENAITVTNINQSDTRITGTGLFGLWAILGDVNNDGYSDLAVSSWEDNRYFLFSSRGSTGITNVNATTAQFVSAPVGLAMSVLLADFNNDLMADLVIGDFSFNVSVFLSASGSAPAWPLPGTASCILSGVGPRLMNAIDINGDGILDLVFSDPGGGTRRYLIYDGRFFSENGSGDINNAMTVLTGENYDDHLTGDVGYF